MNFTTTSMPIGKIDTPLSGVTNIKTLPVPGIQYFANLFSDALSIKVGNENSADPKKRQGKGESALWGHWG